MAVAFFAESDTGIETAVRVECALGAHFGNGNTVALRWKNATVAAVAAAGLAAPRQLMAASWPEAEAFVQRLIADRRAVAGSWAETEPVAAELTPEPVAVLKPCRGAASVDVFAVASAQEARIAFDAIHNSPRSHGA